MREIGVCGCGKGMRKMGSSRHQSYEGGMRRVSSYQWERKVADTVPSQPPGNPTILDVTSIERAILDMLKHPNSGILLLLPIGHHLCIKDAIA